MKNFKQKFILVFLSFIGSVYALNPFVIKNIRVDGLQRIEVGTVFSYLPVKTGDVLTNENADEIIKKLYSTGFFTDVRLEEQGDSLIIGVIERPIIATLTLIGEHAFDHDLLKKSLKSNGLNEGGIFNQSVLDQAILGMKAEYYNRGLYSVVITGKVVALERNRVAVSVVVSEGDNAKISAITFVGNKKFSGSNLSGLMFLNTGNLLSFWYKDNQYSNDKLSGDIETIRNFYLNQGYINFKINSIQVQLSADKQSVYITVNLSEGDQYKVKKIKISGDIKNVPISELQEELTISEGSIVNQGALNRVIENLKNKLGNYGYAFAMISPIPEIDQNNKTVSYSLLIDIGKKFYIRQINLKGNDKTRDIVLRRELRQTEGSLYSSSKIKRSKERLNQTGYFEKSDINITPVEGSNNLADMDVSVEERSTGSIQFGIGFSQNQGLLLNGQLTQSNLFGSGKTASFSASTTQISKSASLSFVDPYAFTNGTSLGYQVYGNLYEPNNAGISPYSLQTLGATTYTQIPVSEYDRITFAVSVENQKVNLFGDQAPSRFVQFVNQYGNDVYSVPFSIGWNRNTTDNMIWPTSGALFNENFDVVLPGIGPQYYRFTSQNSWFIPISQKLTWKINGQLGFINSYGTQNTVPFYQNYYAGGINSLRGYSLNSIGPKASDGAALGGTRQLLLSNDFLLPMPGIKNEKTVRIGGFFDAGTLWGGDNFNVNMGQEFRASYGAELIWISPLIPIKLVYAWPLFNQSNDNLQALQVMLGASF